MLIASHYIRGDYVEAGATYNSLGEAGMIIPWLQ